MQAERVSRLHALRRLRVPLQQPLPEDSRENQHYSTLFDASSQVHLTNWTSARNDLSHLTS